MATHRKKPRDDMIKIAPTVEIYNRPMVQKHPVQFCTVTKKTSRFGTIEAAHIHVEKSLLGKPVCQCELERVITKAARNIPPFDSRYSVINCGRFKKT